MGYLARAGSARRGGGGGWLCGCVARYFSIYADGNMCVCKGSIVYMLAGDGTC